MEFRLYKSRQETMSSNGIYRSLHVREAGRICAVRRRVLRTNGPLMDSASRHLELVESGKHLTDALAAERKVYLLSARNLGDQERWRRTLREIKRLAKLYAIALENYREATLSELDRHKRRGAQSLPLSD